MRSEGFTGSAIGGSASISFPKAQEGKTYPPKATVRQYASSTIGWHYNKMPARSVCRVLECDNLSKSGKPFCAEHDPKKAPTAFKECPVCHQNFWKSFHESSTQWARRVTCSVECRHKYQVKTVSDECTEDGCDRDIYAKGICKKHYQARLRLKAKQEA